MIKKLKFQNKEKIINAAKEKDQVTHIKPDRLISKTPGFSLETLKLRETWNGCSKDCKRPQMPAYITLPRIIINYNR